MELQPILDIPAADFKINCTLFEDNKGAYELAKVPENRSNTKFAAAKYHHFREAVKDEIILAIRVDIIEQIAHISTKPLVNRPLEYLWKQIIGWSTILSHGNCETTSFHAYGTCYMGLKYELYK